METEAFRIRIAADHEDLDKVRSWLPQAFLSSPRPVFFLVERKEASDVIGLGSLRALGKRGKLTGRFQLFVMPEFRRKGVASLLMQDMIAHCRREDVPIMLAGVPVADGGGESVFFEFLTGFEIKRTLYKFAMKTEIAWNYLQPLIARLSEKGGLPTGYEIVSLEDADQRRVHRFVLDHLGGIPDSLAQRLRGGEGGFLPTLSIVVRTVEGPA
ncbi:MAG: GNAT family N-acetyltransferase, partial [Verrucomicrobia bacterium]|nr:GNAT family N-acetyltransferase [Verrucomicrobiota bacterium]